MKTIRIKDVVRQTMVAAIYVEFVLLFQFMSFEVVQFRIAEVLLILIFFDRRSIWGLSIGTFLANWMLSPFGLIDAFVGMLATVLALVLMLIFRKRSIIALIFPAITNGLIVGYMVAYIYDISFMETAAWVFFGEFVVLYVLGLPLYLLLRNNRDFQELFS
ncbi:MAG: QueT transporter family protein [Acholeplasmataceae bacterium]